MGDEELYNAWKCIANEPLNSLAVCNSCYFTQFSLLLSCISPISGLRKHESGRHYLRCADVSSVQISGIPCLMSGLLPPAVLICPTNAQFFAKKINIIMSFVTRIPVKPFLTKGHIARLPFVCGPQNVHFIKNNRIVCY
jgi:hypothetical protein